MKYFKLKFLLLFFALAAALPPAWAETVTTTIEKTSSDGTTLQWSNANLTFNFTEKPTSTNYSVETANNARGLGTGAKTGTHVLTSDQEFTNVKKVTITASTNDTGNSLSVKVGNTNIGNSATLTKEDVNKDFTFETSSGLNGNIVITINDAKKTVWIKTISVTYDTGGSTTEKVATPTFSVPEGRYTEAQSVEIFCATAGATIYYSLDGHDPTTSSDVYNGPITISRSTTLRAFAAKDGMEDSEIASAVYNLPKAYTKLAQANDLEVGTYFKYDGYAEVTFVNGSDIWIRDDDGTGGYLYKATTGFVNGDVLKAGWVASRDAYNGLIEYSSASGLEKSGSATVNPVVLQLDDITIADMNKYVRLENVTIDDFTDVQWYDKFKNDLVLTQGKTYNVEGIVGYFNKLQFHPISIEEVDAPTPELAITLDPAEKSATAGETIDVAVTANTDAEVIYEYTCNPATATLNETATGFTITSATAGTVTVTVNAMDEDYREATATGTYTFTAAPEPGTDCPAVIEFNDNGSDSSSAFSDVASFKDYITAGKDFVSNMSCDKVYPGDTGIKFSSSKANGYLTINLANLSSGSWITSKIIVNAKKYSSDEAKISVNDSEEVTLTGEYADYEFPITSTEPLESITIDATKRMYVKSITIMHDCGSDIPEPVQLSVALDPAEKTYTVGDVAKIMVTVENGNDDTMVTYKINGGEDKDYDAESGIVLPNDKAKEYTVEVYATDGYREATATGTYSFTAAPAFDITLTPNKEGNYTVGYNAVVTVAVDKVIGEEYIVTYTIGNSENQIEYNAETGIVLPNDKAGDVTVKVYVTDGYDHEGEGTATATYHFVAAPAISITFDPASGTAFNVGDEAKVKVNISGTIGEYEAEYKVNDEEVSPEEGYIILPNDKYGDVKLDVTVIDAYEHEGEGTATATYTFNQLTPTFAYSAESATATYGAEATLPSLNNPNGLTVTYKSSDENVATVDVDGKVTIMGAGTTTITATGAATGNYNGATASYELTVNKAEAGISFEAESASAVVGSEFTAPALNNPADLDVTYTSSNPEVATVDQNGKVTIVGEGTTTITATTTGNDNYEGAEVSYTLTVAPQPVVAMPTFSLVAGSYTGAQQLTINCATEGATISYSTDGGNTWTNGNTVNVDKDMTIMAKASKDGYTTSETATATYIIEIPAELPDMPAMKGYCQIKNNGNGMYANVAGRKTLTFTDAPADKAGTVIYVETNGKGQVQSLRSQGADLQGYANRAMKYVPDVVQIVVDKLHAEGAGEILGQNGLDEIMAKFNESFDYHLYVEQAGEGFRLYGKTPSMQPVVDFYREHTAQVEAKLPQLEQFINDALTKLRNKIGGSSVFTPFSLHQIWEKMGSTLTEPTDEASIMAFYREVLNNKNYVWDFAYQTAMIYVNNVKNHPRWSEVEAELGEYAQYIDKIDQIRPDFKYYVVADGNKPDFISEGNKDIIDNAARTIWTMEDRTDFTVNIAGEPFGCPYAGGIGGVATTNYTDFAYAVPEGVTAYKVAGVENGIATLEALSGVIPAQTPVLLMAKEAGDYALTLSTEAGTAVSGNLLVGPDYLINTYKLTTPQVEGIFNMIKEKLGEDFYNTYVKEYEHLMYLNSGTVNNKYFWGLKEEDVKKCTYLDEEGVKDYVVRGLDGNAFVNNKQVKTNKAFLVSEDAQIISLNKRGDVNHDGRVNIKDVTDLIDRLLDPENTVACPYCSDFNLDSKVNIKDVTDLIDFLLVSGIDTHVDTTTPDPEAGN